MSIVTRWTLRYALAMLVLLALLGTGQFLRVRDRIWQDARLLMELQVHEVQEVVERAPNDLAAITAYVEQHIESAPEDLHLGIRLVARDGRILVERGSFRRLEIPPPAPGAPPTGGRRPRVIDAGAGAPYFEVVAPTGIGRVQVVVDSTRFARSVADVRNIFLLSLPLALLATVLLGWWLAHGIVRPIQEMTETAARISSSQLDEKVPVRGTGDELDQLAETLNAMIARIRTGVRRLREFASNVSHQLRNPLSLLRNRLELAARRPRSPEADQALILDSLRDVERIEAAIRALLRLAQADGGLPPEQLRPVELGDLAASVGEFFEPLAEERNLKLTLRRGVPAVVLGERQSLHELVANLVDNAIKYTGAAGEVRIETGTEGDEALLSVSDTGRGMSEAEIALAFERFERGATSADVPGAGLGLAVAQEVARAHGGRIEVESAVGRGSRFTLRLPLAPGEVPAP